MLAINHISTTCKGDNATYKWQIIGVDGEHIVNFTMPIKIAVLGDSLAPIAIHLCYKSQDRVKQKLNAYYDLLRKEGHNVITQRRADLLFYQKALKTFGSNFVWCAYCKSEPTHVWSRGYFTKEGEFVTMHLNFCNATCKHKHFDNLGVF